VSPVRDRYRGTAASPAVRYLLQPRETPGRPEGVDPRRDPTNRRGGVRRTNPAPGGHPDLHRPPVSRSAPGRGASPLGPVLAGQILVLHLPRVVQRVEGGVSDE